MCIFLFLFFSGSNRSDVDTANRMIEADQMAVTAMIVACGQGNAPLLVKRAIDTGKIVWTGGSQN